MSVVRTELALKLRIYDEDGNSVLLPVAQASMRFAINSVPSCEVHIGLGVDTGHPKLEMRVNSTTRKLLRRYATCQLLGIFTGQPTTGANWPSDAQLLFEGRIGRVQDAIVTDGAALKVVITHWLGDLASGQIVPFHTNSMDPVSGTDYAAMYSVRRTGVQRPPSAIGGLDDARILHQENFAQDIWANGIKALWAALITNPPAAPVSVKDCGEDITSPPPELVAAMRRLEGPSPELGLDRSRWAVPLNIDDGTTSRDTVARHIASSLASTPLANYAGTDAWSMLVRYICPNYSLILVPRIKSAIIAPDTATIRSPYCQRIISSDIVNVDTTGGIHRPVRGVGIVQPIESRTGAISTVVNTDPVCYTNENVPDGGKYYYFRPPPWLSTVARYSTGAKTQIAQRRPNNGVAGAGAPAETPEQIRLLESRQDLLQDYARYKYTVMSSFNNTATVTGRLRFDIAPGSNIEVAAKTEQIAGLGVNTPQMQGMVSHVTIVMNAPQAKAYTVFQLHNVRSLDDNERDEVTVEQHPLYLDNYYGCPLSDELAVPQCPE